MAVNLTVGFQDQYSQGFQQLTTQLEAQEKAAKALAQATLEHNDSLARMKQEQAEAAQAAKEHNEALRRMAKEHGDASKSMQKSSAGMRQASGSLDTQLSKTTKSNKDFGLGNIAMSKGVQMAGSHLKGLADGFTGIQGSGDLAGKAVQKFGGSLGKLGVIAAVIYGTFKLIKSLWPNLIEDQTQEAVKKFNKSWEQGNKNLRENTEWLRSLRQWITGVSEDSRKLTAINEKQAESWKNLRQLREQSSKRLAAEEEAGKISQMTKEQADAAIRAENAKIAARDRTDKKTAELDKASVERIEAIERRKLEIKREAAAKAEEYIREATAREEQIRIGAIERERRREDEASERRVQKLREEHDYRYELGQLREQADVSRKDRNIRLIQDRITRRIDAEKQADLEATDSTKERTRIEINAEEKKHAAIRELEREAILNRAALEAKATEDKLEQARIAARTIEELREMEFRHALELEQKKAQAAKQAADREVAIEREKIDKIKAMTDKQGKNTFQSLMAQQGQRKDDQGRNLLFEQVVRNRMTEAMKKDPDMSRHEQTQTNRLIRRQTMRGMTTTGERTSQAEIERAQSDMAANLILDAHKRGKVDNAFLKANAEIAKALQEKGKLEEEVVRAIGELRNEAKSQRQQEQSRVERLRAQRRAMRG